MEIILNICYILVAIFIFLIIYSQIKENCSKKSTPPSDTLAEINRLKQENQSLRKERRDLLEETSKLKRDYEELKNLYRKRSKQCDDLLYWSQDSTKSFLPPDLLSLYRDSIHSPRLEKAMNGSFSFVYPLSVSGTVSSSGNMYHTTLTGCSCEDHQKRHVVCKHMLALALHVRAFALDNFDPPESQNQ